MDSGESLSVKNTINTIVTKQRRLNLNLSELVEMVQEEPSIWNFSEALKEELDSKDAAYNSLVEKRAAKKGKAKQEAGEPEIDKEYIMLYLEDDTIKKILTEVLNHPMSNAGVIFNGLGAKPTPKYWESEEKLLTLLLDVLDCENLSLIKLNEIDMSEPFVQDAVQEVKVEEGEQVETEVEPKEDKEAEKERLTADLTAINDEQAWIAEKLESGEIEGAKVLKLKYNKNFKLQLKYLNQIIEEPQFPDPEQLDLPPDVTLQIVKKPKVNKNVVEIDKRFKLLSRQKREVKEEEKVEDPKAKGGKDAKGKKEEEKVEQQLTEWEYVEKTRWILEPKEELELYMQFYSETLGEYVQGYEFQMCNTFETVKFNVDAECDIPRLNMDPKLLFTNHRQS